MAPAKLGLPTILEAQRRIKPYISPTRLQRSEVLSDLTGGDVWLKPECHQITGAFKARGALNKIGLLTAEEKSRGLATGSAGNHGLGLAYAAQCWGQVNADIFVPSNAPQVKIERLSRYPVDIHPAGTTYEAARQAATDFAQANGGTYIPAYDDEDVIAGQGTIGLEILSDLPHTDQILVPVGGGGLIAGVATAAKAINPGIRVVGVQAEASPSALLSLRDGVAYDPYDHEPTIADGLAGGFGAVPLLLAGHWIDQVLLASEDELRQAIFELVDKHQLVVEPAGAAAIVPLINSELAVTDQTVVCVLSGGNLDTALLRNILIEFEDGT